MQQTKESLFAKGTIGYIVFLLRWIMVVFPVPTLIFGIYCMTISISDIWKSAIGVGIFVVTLFLVLLSIGSIIFITFMSLGIMQTANTICHFYIIDTILAYILAFIVLSLTTEQKYSLYTENIMDYCIRNPKNEFCVENDRYSVEKYVRTRTTSLYSALAGVLAPWILSFIAFMIALLLLSSSSPGTPQAGLTTPQRESVPLAIEPEVQEEIPKDDDYSYSYSVNEEEDVPDKQQIRVGEA